MKVFVVGKREFDSYMGNRNISDDNVESKDETFFISINDTRGTDETPHFKKNHGNVMVLFFDDVEEDLVDKKWGFIKAFSMEQAKELIEFIESNKNKETCIVHCSAGISRSGAVGAFVNDYCGGDYFEFKKLNPHILPNGTVSRLLHQAMREK